MPHALERLLVADSFRVRVDPLHGTAEVRGLELHLARFRDAVLAAVSEEANLAVAFVSKLDAFLAGSSTRISEFGEGWPRLELWGSVANSAELPELRLSLRDLPQLNDTLTLRTVIAPKLPHRERKGPNISEYRRLGAQLGAEGLLLNHAGAILEGTTTSLLWWKGGRLHCSVSGQRVSSVTEQLLSQFARSLRSPILPSAATPTELAVCEVWAVNALHGIRVVTHIDEAPLSSPDGERLQRFRDALNDTWQPIRASGHA